MARASLQTTLTTSKKAQAPLSAVDHSKDMSMRPSSHVINVSETSEPGFKLMHLFSPIYFIPAVAVILVVFLFVRSYSILNMMDTSRPL